MHAELFRVAQKGATALLQILTNIGRFANYFCRQEEHSGLFCAAVYPFVLRSVL